MEKMKPRIRSLNDLFANEEVQPYPNEVSAPAVQTADEKNGLQFIAPKKIRTFLNHPFRLYDGERLDDLVESVKANGILIPTIVRKIEKDENGYEYEMLAGHNRQNAAIIADLEVIEGSIPSKQLKMLLGWAAFHQEELMENWHLAENKQELFAIEPLK